MPRIIHTDLPFAPATAAIRPEFPCQGLSLRRIAQLTAMALAIIFVNKLGMIGNAVFFMTVMGMLLFGTARTAVAGITMGLLALCANTAFVAKTTVWTIARFVNLFAFTGRFALAGGAGMGWMTSPAYLALTAFVVVAAFCSLLSGYFVHIALLKLVSFWIGSTGFFACIHAIRRQRIDTTEWFVAQAAAVCGLCIIALATGVASNFKLGMEARGLYNLGLYHSQTMGPIGAMMIVYLSCVFLFAGHRNRWICLPLIAFLLYCVGLTGSRTGMGTLFLGLTTAIGTAFIWNRKGLQRLRLNVPRAKILAWGLAGIVALACYDAASGGQLTRKWISFAAKQGKDVESLTFEEAVSTRAGVVEQSMENFRRSPVFGIGFQVSTTEYFIQNASLFYAPIEKGFLPSALLEEVGVVGTSFFVIFVITMAVQLVRERNIPGVAMFATLLASNLGEASLFALAGHGAYGWILLVGGIVLGDRCIMPSAFGSLPRRQPRRGPLLTHDAPAPAA